MVKKSLSKVIVVVLILILGAGGGYYYKTHPDVQKKVYRVVYPSFCDEEIHFRIDRVDDKFGLTSADFIERSSKGAEIWNEIYGENLFVYDPKGPLSINLIFDERQRLTNQINQMSSKISATEENLKPSIAFHQQKVAEFQKKMDAFNEKVKYWNERGGAPEDEFNKLIAEQNVLKAEAESLNARAAELNQSAVAFNSEISNYNNTISQFNSTLKERPEEGLFDGKKNKISIYFYINDQELIHTLAHEFGHAVRMAHVGNPDALMFSKTNTKTVPTTDDVKELARVCKRSPIWEVLRDRYFQASKRLE